MSKGEERRVLRNWEEKFGWSGERDLSFPSYIYFLTILSVSHLSNFDSRFFCSFGRFTSSEDRWKASAQLEGEEDCEVLTTMGLIHQACVCTNLCYFTSLMLNCCKLKGESKTRTALTGYLKLKEMRENTNYSAPPPHHGDR